MSGTSLLVQALPYDAHEDNYKRAMEALGMTASSAEERVEALLDMPGQELIAKLPPSVLTAPAIDGDLVRPGVTYAELGKLDSDILPGNSWCRELLIGDAEIDVSSLTCFGVSRLIHLHTVKHLRVFGTTDEN